MAMAITTRSLSKWPVLSLCAPELLSEVKMAVVFGAGGNEALLVTRSDDVFGVGTNSSGCLGLGERFVMIGCVTMLFELVGRFWISDLLTNCTSYDCTLLKTVVQMFVTTASTWFS